MPLGRAFTLIGSRNRAHLHLLSRTVSKCHAVIVHTDTGLYIRDLASRTHVLINGKPVKEMDLHDGDYVKIGSFSFKFQDASGKSMLRPPGKLAAASLAVDGAPAPIPLEGRAILIGRRPTCDISLMEMSVSTAHALIYEMNGQHIVRDLGSRTGTYVNGTAVSQKVLEFDDLIRVGETDLRYVAPGAEGAGLDELEDLIGTAPLDDEPLLPMLDEAPAPLKPERPPVAAREPTRGAPGAGGKIVPAAAASPVAPAPAAAPPAQPSIPLPHDDETVEDEPGLTAIPRPAAEAPDLGALDEIDLEAEPSSSDTAPLPVERASPPPVLSPLVVDADAVDIREDEKQVEDEPQLMVDGELHREKLSSSGTFAGVASTGEAAPGVVDEGDVSAHEADLGLDFWEEPSVVSEGQVADMAPPPVLDETVVMEAPGINAPALESLAPLEAAIPAAPEPPVAESSSASAVVEVPQPAPAVAEELEEMFPVTEPSLTELESLPMESAAPELLETVPAESEAEPTAEEPAPAPIALEPAPLAAAELAPIEAEEEPAAAAEVERQPLAAEELAPGEGEEEPAAAGEIEPAPFAIEELAPIEAEPEPAAAAEVEPAAFAIEELVPSEAEPEPAAEAVEPASASVAPAAEPTPLAEEPAPEPIAFEPEPAVAGEPAPGEAKEQPAAAVEAAGAPAAEEAESEFVLGTQEISAAPAPVVESPAAFAAEAIEEESPAVEGAPFTSDAFAFDDIDAAAVLPAEEQPWAEIGPADEDSLFDTIEAEDEIDLSSELSAEVRGETPAPGAPIVTQADLPAAPLESMGAAPEFAIEPQAVSEDLSQLAPPETDLAPPAAAAVGDVEPLSAEAAPTPLEEPLDTAEMTASGPVVPLDPFQGMSRDLGSFLGGMPLKLPEPLADRVAFGQVPVTLPSDAAEPSAADEWDEAPARNFVPIDDFEPTEAATEAAADEPAGMPLPESEPTESPLEAELDEVGPASEAVAEKGELFDASPQILDDLPDSLEAISDTTESVGEPEETRKDPVVPASAGKTPRKAPPPPAAPGQRKGKTPPRPPRTAAIAAGQGADTIIPPFKGQPGVGAGLTTAFDGLAATPVLETDVFSQMSPAGASGLFREGKAPAIPAAGLGSGVGGASSRLSPKAQAWMERRGLQPKKPPRPGTAPSADAPAPPTGDELPPAAPPAADGLAPSAPPAPTGPTGPMPKFTPPPYPPPPAKRRWLGVLSLVPLMIVLLGGSASGIWFLAPVRAQLQATLKFDRLNKLSSLDRRDFVRQQRAMLEGPTVKTLAQNLFESRGGHKGGGFLYATRPEDVTTYEEIAASASSPEHTDRLLITHAGADSPDDLMRLSALVSALYTEDKPLADAAAKTEQMLRDAQQALSGLEEQSARLAEQLKEEERLAAQQEADDRKLTDAKAQATQLWQKWTDASAAVQKLQGEVEKLEVAAAGTPSTRPGAADAVASDAQVHEMSQSLQKLNESLSAARNAHSSAAEQAGQAMEKALSQFQDQIASARGSLKDGSELGTYLAAAQQVQDTIRQLNAELVEQQKSDEQRLGELKRRLAGKTEVRLKAAWAGDSELKQLEQDLQVTEHQYNAAVGSDLKPEATRLGAERDVLKKRIESRQNLLATGDLYADELRDLQQFIDESLARMDKDRARNDQRMQELLKSLAAAAPKVEKLPADQKALAEQLKNRLDEMNEARRQWALAGSNSDSDPEVQKLESTVTSLQAKLDARTRELTEESRKTLTAQQEQARLAALAEKKSALESAQRTEADASAAYRANHQQLVEADVEAANAKDAARKLVLDNGKSAQLEDARRDKEEEIKRLGAAQARSVIPEPPSDDAVSMVSQTDRRVLYIGVTSAAIVLLFSLLIVLSVRYVHHHDLPPRPEPDDELRPFPARSSREPLAV